MELPLVLSLRSPACLTLGIPLWYRLSMGLLEALLVVSMYSGGSSPGPLGWIFSAIVLLALLYEERWSFDTARGTMAHRFGLVIVAKTFSVPLSGVTGFRLVPWTRGTLPGSAEERTDAANTLAVSRGAQDGQANPRVLAGIHKKPFLALVCETDGQTLLINMVSARKGERLRAQAERLARHCGKPLAEG
ncbi:MAG: hypothetical protein WCQ50_00595 [Spirochaetota bacterium]